jgi:hypothetical protein
MGPPGLGSSQYGSRYSMSRARGPLDIFSLVIPRLGDNTHLLSFDLCIGKWCRGHDEEDVKMIMFVYSFEGDAVEWFSEQDPNKFSTLAEIYQAFRERWGD